MLTGRLVCARGKQCQGRKSDEQTDEGNAGWALFFNPSAMKRKDAPQMSPGIATSGQSADMNRPQLDLRVSSFILCPSQCTKLAMPATEGVHKFAPGLWL